MPLILTATAEAPDYTEVLSQINARVLALTDLLRGVTDQTELIIGILAGIVCFIGVLFGFQFIRFLFQQIRR